MTQFHARHGSHLAELQGVRLPSYEELDAEAAAAYAPQDYAVCGDMLHEAFDLGGYGALRALALCRVRGDCGPTYNTLPQLPVGLQELTLDGGPGELSASSPRQNLSPGINPNPNPHPNPDPNPGLPAGAIEDGDDDDERGIDLQHLTALTRLTLVGMTARLLWDGLGSRGSGGSARLPPSLQTLSVVEPPADPTGTGASRISLALMLRSSPPALPPAGIPLLHVRADEVVCGHLQRWPADAREPALPWAIRVQTQCLSLSLPCVELVRDDDPFASDRASGRDHVASNAHSVRPVEALCEMLSGMPAGVEEIGLGFADDRQPLRLRLRLRLPSDPSAQPSYDEVSFASADELANSVQHLAGDYDLRIRVVRDRHDDYVLVCRRARYRAAKQQGCAALCADCMAEMRM